MILGFGRMSLSPTAATRDRNMELTDGVLRLDNFLAVTLGIIVLFVGKRINDVVVFLREFSIPEPVTGGLLFSILFGLV
jgi:ESS family glutamate:Na+ symporter